MTWTQRRSRTTRRATAALCAVLLAVALPVAAPPAAAQTIGPPYLAEATDPAVTTLASDLGIPIEEAQYRIGWQEPAIQLGEELYEALGEQFGGLWIDEEGGGRVKVGIVGGDPSPATQAQALIDQKSLGTVSDIVPVQFSYAQLERDSAWLTAAIGEETGTGPRLSSEMHVSGNRIVLLVPEDVALTAAQEAVVEQAEQQLGPRLAIETWSGSGQLQACSYMLGFNCDRPLRGGVRTFLDTNPPIYACTTGFNARSLSNGLWYVMTAGHCGDEGERFLAFQPARTAEFHLIGAVHNSVNVGNDDYAIIRIENVPGWNPRNWVYVHSGADTVINPVYSITGTSTSPEGTRVCLSGATSGTGTDCGRVIRLNYDGPTGLARAAYCSQGGDSGGPVYSNHKARGLHVAAPVLDCQHALFQGVREAAREMNVYVVVS